MRQDSPVTVLLKGVCAIFHIHKNAEKGMKRHKIVISDCVKYSDIQLQTFYTVRKPFSCPEKDVKPFGQSADRFFVRQTRGSSQLRVNLCRGLHKTFVLNLLSNYQK